MPDGLEVRRLEGQLEFAPDVSQATFEVRSDNRSLGVLFAENRGGAREPVPFQFSIPELRRFEQSVTLELVSRLVAPDYICSTDAQRAFVDIVDVSVLFSGQETPPATIARFVPPVLTKLRVYVADPPTLGEVNAVSRLVTGFIARYPGQPVEVVVEALARGAPTPELAPTPFERALVVREARPNRLQTFMSGGVPFLMVHGEADSMQQQVDLVITTSRLLALSNRVNSVTVNAPQTIPQRRQTFLSSGRRPPAIAGVGTLEMPMDFSQAELGGLTEGLTVHLEGSTSPVPDGGTAVLLLVMNGEVIVSKPSKGARFEMTSEIPSRLIRRDNNMALRVDYTPPGGRCVSGAHPFTAQVSLESYFDVDLGESGLGGFLRFPQALLPRFSLALDKLSFDRLAIAADLLVGLQRASKLPLQPEAVLLESARTGKGALVVVSESNAFVRSLKPPIDLKSGKGIDTSGRVAVSMTFQESMAAIEAFVNRDRHTLLAVFQDDADLLQSLVHTVVDSPDGWLMLTGDTYLGGPDAKAVALDIRGGVPKATSSRKATASFPWLLVILLPLAALFGRQQVTRRQRRRARTKTNPRTG